MRVEKGRAGLLYLDFSGLSFWIRGVALGVAFLSVASYFLQFGLFELDPQALQLIFLGHCAYCFHIINLRIRIPNQE